MLVTDFDQYSIVNFSVEEIENTGAKLADIQLELIYRLQYFRNKIQRVVCLLPNGLTTGRHTAKEHPNGLAVDFALREGDGPVVVSMIFKKALESGFKGIGIYHNEAAYSFHFDLRKEFSFWCGFKKHRKNNWEYQSLIVDPIYLLK